MTSERFYLSSNSVSINWNMDTSAAKNELQRIGINGGSILKAVSYSKSLNLLSTMIRHKRLKPIQNPKNEIRAKALLASGWTKNSINANSPIPKEARRIFLPWFIIRTWYTLNTKTKGTKSTIRNNGAKKLAVVGSTNAFPFDPINNTVRVDKQ